MNQLSLCLVVALLYSTTLINTVNGNCPEDETPSPSPSPSPSPVTASAYKYNSPNTTVNAPPVCVMPPDCKAWRQLGVNQSGVYPINPDGNTSFQVYCDMETDGGGWTVFQRRQDGSVDFFLDWVDYERGFGNLNGDFWLGLTKLQLLTHLGSKKNSLRVDMERFSGKKYFANYNQFSVSGNKYTLTVGGYSGNASDSLAVHNGWVFSTKDRDDVSSCSNRYKGGWWYTTAIDCYYSNLNGIYHGETNHHGYTGFSWLHSHGGYETLKKAKMMLRANM